MTRSYAVLYGDDFGEIDREQIIRNPADAIIAIALRCTFAPGDCVKIEMTEIEPD